MNSQWRNYRQDFRDLCWEIWVAIQAELFGRRECPHCGKFQKRLTKTGGKFEPVTHWYCCPGCGINWKFREGL